MEEVSVDAKGRDEGGKAYLVDERQILSTDRKLRRLDEETRKVDGERRLGYRRSGYVDDD